MVAGSNLPVPPMLHAKLQAAVQLDTGLYVVEREALCATFLSVSMLDQPVVRERPAQASASSS